MKLIHLSHTDLDGYTCQLIMQQVFNDVTFLNSNYGLEVKLNLKRIIDQIENSKEREFFVLITDLNLQIDDGKNLEKKIKYFNENGYKIKLQLLDHHASGQKSADKFDWYFLDSSRSATKIVYDYMKENYRPFKEDVEYWLKPLVDAVNAVDIWLDHEVDNFEFGKVLLTMISRAKEVNYELFTDLNREYRLFLLNKSCEYLFEENRNVKLDMAIHGIKKEFLAQGGDDNTLDNLSARYLVKSLESKKDELTIYYKEHKGLLTYCIGSVSIPANTFLKANPDFDFFIDLGRKGHSSLRADGKVDVAWMASKLANGGGHVNASGAKFEDFKETINYSDVKEYIENKINTLL
jgi:oligoribonuclease NrnB/cAMP/cGMP phosphodiesterase (DHH superfamily)